MHRLSTLRWNIVQCETRNFHSQNWIMGLCIMHRVGYGRLVRLPICVWIINKYFTLQNGMSNVCPYELQVHLVSVRHIVSISIADDKTWSIHFEIWPEDMGSAPNACRALSHSQFSFCTLFTRSKARTTNPNGITERPRSNETHMIWASLYLTLNRATDLNFCHAVTRPASGTLKVYKLRGTAYE